MKHTKGEWIVSDECVFESTITSDGIRIAEVKSFGDDANFNDATIDERQANSKLIAAAPDLLEALQEMKLQLNQWMEQPKDTIGYCWAEKAISAIKKATE